MKFQIVTASVFGVACLGLKVYLTRRYGIIGVPWATLITYVSISGISCAIYVPRVLKHLHPAPNAVIMATPVAEE